MGYQDFPSQNFRFTVSKNFVGEHFGAMFEKNSGSDKIYGYEGGYQDFRPETYFSQCRKLSQRNTSVLCFRKNPVVQEIMDKRGRGYQDFPLEKLCLTMPKSFVG